MLIYTILFFTLTGKIPLQQIYRNPSFNTCELFPLSLGIVHRNAYVDLNKDNKIVDVQSFEKGVLYVPSVVSYFLDKNFLL